MIKLKSDTLDVIFLEVDATQVKMNNKGRDKYLCSTNYQKSDKNLQ